MPEGGGLISTARLGRFLTFDAERGRVRCEGGLVLRELIELALPHGWFPPVVPGTQRATVGGMVATDAHGKNHHCDGSFGSWVRELLLLTPRGGRRRCSPEQDPDLFWATVGGLGQTGVVAEVTLDLVPIETAWLRVERVVTRDLDHTLEALAEHAEARYSVAWIDSLATGRSLGRGVVLVGEHATLDDLRTLRPALATRPRTLGRRPSLRWPFFLPSWLGDRGGWKAFNSLYYAQAGRRPSIGLTHYQPFFFPLDAVDGWNRAFGRQGFHEYQLAVGPRQARPLVRTVLETLSSRGFGSFLSVLKRFGPGNQAPLSFPLDGFTFAVDMAVGRREPSRLLDRLDESLVAAGGRLYLAKDSRVGAEHVGDMYPELDRWRAVAESVDPEGVLRSRLVARTRLRP